MVRNKKRETMFSILRIVGLALFLLTLAISFIAWQQWNARRQQMPQEPQAQELTDQQKRAILESLSPPSDALQYTDEEKKRILQSLSAPKDAVQHTEEEKKALLESLSAPQ